MTLENSDARNRQKHNCHNNNGTLGILSFASFSLRYFQPDYEPGNETVQKKDIPIQTPNEIKIGKEKERSKNCEREG